MINILYCYVFFILDIIIVVYHMYILLLYAGIKLIAVYL